jgi:DNA-binding MarR family transcriptional regulator
MEMQAGMSAGTSSVARKAEVVATDAKSAYFLTFKLDLIKTEMIRRANGVYRPACGLDVRSLRVVRIVCDTPGITATALKEHTLIEKTLLSKLMADLIEKKLVRRTIHPDDARHFQLWATAAGEKTRAASDALGQSLERKCCRCSRKRNATNSIASSINWSTCFVGQRAVTIKHDDPLPCYFRNCRKRLKLIRLRRSPHVHAPNAGYGDRCC